LNGLCMVCSLVPEPKFDKEPIRPASVVDAIGATFPAGTLPKNGPDS